MRSQANNMNDELPESPGLSIEDLNLPKSIVTRLAKGVLPPNTQIQANAILAMSKSATLFINYIASLANEFAATAERKTVNPNDVFAALDDSEFSSWRPRLEAELQKYTEIRGQRKEILRPKDKDPGDEPVTKRQKRDNLTENHNEVEPEDEPDPEDDVQSEIGSNEENDGNVTIEAEDEGEEEDEEENELPDLSREEPMEIEDHVLEAADEALDNGDDSD
ncbi:hypothetical protein K3495_g7504 [Podosphaera aphanis]|nr:hypothetical protein K3495_g7504 [Podosphaera aphanis]